MQRLVSYNYHGLRQWGVLSSDGNSILSSSDMEEVYFIPLADTLDEFIELGEEGLINLAKIIELEKNNHAISPIAISEVELTVPYYPKRNIFCVGKNYRSHIEEFENDSTAKNPDTPVFFTKATTSVIGPNDFIDSHPEITSQVDYEGEQVLRQEGSTSDLIFSIPKIIASLSKGMTLFPGDIIATGTPQGVGMGLNPPVFLKKDDVIEITIDPIGTLKNIVK